MADADKKADPIVPSADPNQPLSPALLKITAVVAFGPFLAQLDTTVVNVALSTLSSELNAPIGTIQWVATGYLLALALMVPLSGWLVDCLGAKRVYIGCFSLFAAASMLCGLSTTAEQLIAFRVLQGLAGGLLAPMAQMMMASYAGPRMSKALSLMSMPVLTAPIFGPSLAGAVLHFTSWHWIFFINFPVGVIAIILAIRLLPPDEALKPRRLDWLGFLLISPGLVLLLDGLKRLTTSPEQALTHELEVAASIILIAAFVVRAWRKGASGLIDVRLFARKRFSTSAMTQFLSNATVQGGQMLVPLYLLTVRDLPAATVGLLMAPMGLGLLCTRPFIDRILRTFGPRRLSAGGAAVCAFATLPFALPGVTLPVVAIAIVLFVRGIGLSFVNMPSIVSAYAGIPRESLPHAATAINIVQRLGGPIAVMTLALLLQHQAGYSSEGVANPLTETGFHVAFAMLCVITTMCLLSAARLPKRM